MSLGLVHVARWADGRAGKSGLGSVMLWPAQDNRVGSDASLAYRLVEVDLARYRQCIHDSNPRFTSFLRQGVIFARSRRKTGWKFSDALQWSPTNLNFWPLLSTKNLGIETTIGVFYLLPLPPTKREPFFKTAPNMNAYQGRIATY